MNDTSELATTTQQRETEITPYVDLVTAKKILQIMVDTPEESFTDSSRIDRIGKYGVGEIREAMRVVTQAVLDTHNAKTDFGYPYVTKVAPHGNLLLAMKNLGAKWGQVSGNAEVIDLDLIVREPQYLGSVLGNSFLLVDDQTGEEGMYTGFTDRRNPTSDQGTSFRKLADRFEIKDFRNLYRGVRWTSANLLKWDEADVVMPEQLSKQALPNSPSQPRSLPTLPTPRPG